MAALRRVVSIALLMLAAACTTSDLSDLVPQSATHGPAIGPRYGDRDPHPWDGRAPWHYAIHGTDVSKYQAEIDWPALRNGGMRFAFIKATEGGDRVDDYFARNWQAARAAGVPRGAYHFYYFCRPAHEQAAWFIRNVPKDPSALPPVLDMEWNHLSPSCKLRPPAATVQSEMRTFLRIIERHYGKRPIIYTSIDFYEDNRLHEFHGYDWWLRSVAAHPHVRYDKRQFLFWQYTGTGQLPGITGDADINVFYGSPGQWRDWLKSVTS